MMFCDPMKRVLSHTSPRFTNILWVVLLFSNAFGAARDHAKYQQRQTEEAPGPASFRSADILCRYHALTTLAGERVAADFSKQNRLKHSASDPGLAPRAAGVPSITRQRLVTTDRSVLYLSFRLLRPKGRAPPASA